MFHNERRVDRRADMVGQRRIGISLLEGVEFPVLDIAQAGREALADQSEQRKDMVAGATGIGKQFFDLQNRVVIEQAVEDIDSLALGRTDRQNAEVAILVRESAVEFRARLVAVMEIDVTPLGSPIASPEELPVG